MAKKATSNVAQRPATNKASKVSAKLSEAELPARRSVKKTPVSTKPQVREEVKKKPPVKRREVQVEAPVEMVKKASFPRPKEAPPSIGSAIGFMCVSAKQRRMESYPVLAGRGTDVAIKGVAKRLIERNPDGDWTAFSVQLGPDSTIILVPLEWNTRPVTKQ